VAPSKPDDADIRIVEYAGPHGALIVPEVGGTLDDRTYPRGVRREMPADVLQRLNDTGITRDHRMIDHGARTKARTADPIEPTQTESARLAAHHGEPASPGGV
jgi:hypothetical protein